MKFLLVFWGIAGPLGALLFLVFSYSGELDRKQARFMAQCEEQQLAVNPRMDIYSQANRVEYCMRQSNLR